MVAGIIANHIIDQKAPFSLTTTDVVVSASPMRFLARQTYFPWLLNSTVLNSRQPCSWKANDVSGECTLPARDHSTLGGGEPTASQQRLKTEPSSTMTKDGSFLTNVGGSEGGIKSIKKPTCNKQHHVINRSFQQRAATFGHIGENFQRWK